MRSQTWFQRRRIGFGWRPASWQGWLVTLLAAGGLVAVLTLLRGSSARAPIAILVVAVYSGVALATGGTRTAEVAPPEEMTSEGELGVSGAEQRQALRGLTSRAARSPEETALV